MSNAQAHAAATAPPSMDDTHVAAGALVLPGGDKLNQMMEDAFVFRTLMKKWEPGGEHVRGKRTTKASSCILHIATTIFHPGQ